MLKIFPRVTLGAYRAYFSGPQLKKTNKNKNQVKEGDSITLRPGAVQVVCVCACVCVCVCVCVLQCRVWAEQAGRRENRRKAVLPYIAKS